MEGEREVILVFIVGGVQPPPIFKQFGVQLMLTDGSSAPGAAVKKAK